MANRRFLNYQPPVQEVYFYRLLMLSAVAVATVNHKQLQQGIDVLWDHLYYDSWLFKSVYFESIWQVLLYLPVTLVPFLIHKLKYFDKYKLDPNVKWHSKGIRDNLTEAILYAAPLMLLDTFTVKKYKNVNPEEWIIRRQNWIQHTRALPITPPTITEVLYQLALAIIIYDFIFGILHYILHRNYFLYKYIHAIHHDHKELHTRIVNQLTVVERILLILSANEALKFTGSHPLTRAIFVPIFQMWLAENHSGYSFPWGLDYVVPFGLVAGSKKHYAHHMHGDRYYAPFFTHVDDYILPIINQYVFQQSRENVKLDKICTRDKSH